MKTYENPYLDARMNSCRTLTSQSLDGPVAGVSSRPWLRDTLWMYRADRQRWCGCIPKKRRERAVDGWPGLLSGSQKWVRTSPFGVKILPCMICLAAWKKYCQWGIKCSSFATVSSFPFRAQILFSCQEDANPWWGSEPPLELQIARESDGA